MKYTHIINTRLILALAIVLLGCNRQWLSPKADLNFIAPDHPELRYTGRVDFSDPQLPRFFQPGIYLDATFYGSSCALILHDQQLWGKQNYYSIIIDGKYQRRQTQAKCDTIWLADTLSKGWHQLRIVKETEANIGWLGFGGLLANKLRRLPPRPARRIEYIGDSITCGASADESAVACGTGVWEDQHNAYLSYGPRTARELAAEWHLSAVSGFGLIHSCCGIQDVLPNHYSSIDLRKDSLSWDFKHYQADLVVIGLGQNDGLQDDDSFCSAYFDFIRQVRRYHPKAYVLCMNSPMANKELSSTLQRQLRRVVSELHAAGEERVGYFSAGHGFTSGCDYHPSLAEHAIIATKLTHHIRQTLNW